MDKFGNAIGKLKARRGNDIYVIKSSLEPRGSLKVHNDFQGKNFDELDLIIHSGGGSIEAAYQIVKTLRKHAKKINGIIPLYAKSAATLISVGLDNLIFGDLGELGPLDAQLLVTEEGDAPRYKSSLNSAKALDQLRKFTLETFDFAVKMIVERSGMRIGEAIDLATKLSATVTTPLFSQINPQKVGEEARALEVGMEYGIRILRRYRGFSQEQAYNIADRLVNNYPSHGFILDVEELKHVGLQSQYAEPEEAEILCEMHDYLLKNPDFIGFSEPSKDTSKKSPAK